LENNEDMVDVVYKKSLPELKNALTKLKDEFSKLEGAKTNWSKLRIDPLIRHLESLQETIESKEFSREFSRLRKGVVLFHSDLVYYRTNIAGLKRILESEKKKKENLN
jgi:hypothetical protein